MWRATSRSSALYDVLVVGLGPAGCSAAVTLGRMQRPVIAVDSGEPRNGASLEAHGFMTRDGASPQEIRERGVAELGTYPDVKVRRGVVVGIEIDDGFFSARLEGDASIRTRRVLLASGLRDVLPPIPGLSEAWGRSVHHCVYCSGWEIRGMPVAVLGSSLAHARVAVHLKQLSENVVLYEQGDSGVDSQTASLLSENSIEIVAERVSRVEGFSTGSVCVHSESGVTRKFGGLFVFPEREQGSGLPAMLDCELLDDGRVATNQYFQTTVRGVFAAGDMARSRTSKFSPHQIVVAAAQGVQAAMVIDQDLLQRKFEFIQRARSVPPL
ncbi:pyridine nucleotide-disulfide oxidoreductase [Streptomyces sp. CB01201]|uniref:NAD(P)/FAD-dependent oxidoreductase n=1 Tax=Streptomyces sp. CB01201 TaxID=2020324 RepID=UPI000C27105E|nr:NAD(P)/FAD-dependent oxidoreductase [Streptomyces sp. CB01201]PJM98515.1 pyridine nucleotide-disulfide oxidoreductase [Streptomyces sp. CB01201]